jgi:hypothetical protein
MININEAGLLNISDGGWKLSKGMHFPFRKEHHEIEGSAAAVTGTSAERLGVFFPAG